MMNKECKQIRDVLDAQIEIIERHIEQHKWFQQISSTDEAVVDFIEKYGFIMREFYCSRICQERFECEIAREFDPK